jgi:hypothetical protein
MHVFIKLYHSLCHDSSNIFSRILRLTLNKQLSARPLVSISTLYFFSNSSEDILDFTILFTSNSVFNCLNLLSNEVVLLSSEFNKFFARLLNLPSSLIRLYFSLICFS